MNEEIIKRVVADLNEKWGNEDWKTLSEEEKTRIVREFIEENDVLNGTVQ